MTYKRNSAYLLARILVLILLLLSTVYLWNLDKTYISAGVGLFSLWWFIKIHQFLIRRFTEIDDFFEAVKYKDFSRKFVEDSGPRDIRNLHKGFNEVNQVFREINSKKEVQYLYLQKILELVDVGIIAYNIDSGEVLWANDSIRDTLNVPSFKRISFVERRKPDLFKKVFTDFHPEPQTLTLDINKNERIKVLISDSVFKIENVSYKLIVLQNIEETLDQNESEAWKKLLSVMTHEIMNSIAPISSLADSLHHEIKAAIEHPEAALDMEDLDMGLTSIRNRSEGLMKFAKTYRNLNKVTQLNLEVVKIKELFNSIENFLLPSLKEKNVEIVFLKENLDLEIKIDVYLIEQVIINIILNAIEASWKNEDPKITVAAEKGSGEGVIIKIADKGTGIQKEIMDTVFVPFFTTKKTGSGIGLSLSKQIMLLHKGKINIYSLEGKGTVVSLIF